MKRKTRVIAGLIGSLLIFVVGMFRLFSESLSSMSVFVAYIFAITGFIGVIANGIILRKS